MLHRPSDTLADEAAVACERLDQLAHAVQRAGHPGRLGQIQTDLFLGMLDGRFHHLTEQQIIDRLLAGARPEDTEPDPEPAREPEPADETPRAVEPEPAPAPEPTPPPEPAPAPEPVPVSTRQPRVGVEVRIGVGTLLGFDEHAGEIPGLGYVGPQLARALVAAQQRGAQWRFALTDPQGELLFAGITRRRPLNPNRQPAHNQERCRGGTIELHLSVDELRTWATDPTVAGAWAPVLADIATQYAHRERLLARLARHPRDRYARAALARHIQIRDRTCCFPGCRRPARTAELDHTREHARGGPTHPDNINPLCEHHHRLKTHRWWHLHQPRPGRFHWTSPLQQRYRTRGDPIRPPSTQPRPRPAAEDPDPGPTMYLDAPILRPPEPPATPPVDDADPDEPPPF